MKLLFFLLLSSYSMVYAQLNIAQSSSDIQWRELENDVVLIYYPDYLENKAQYIANLIKHYSSTVGQTYNISQPEKFTLILRAEFADANGFVTLGPRRSEWYSSANITPFVGGLEWYQALAIHEYRHINQFDFMFQGYNKGLYYIFGDMGRSIGTVLTAPAWFFEGDAVWTETKYTDAGRGRSPRFSARMRALVDAGFITTLDHYLINDFVTPLPNHYVYGYFLSTKAINDYGEDVWRYITKRASHSFPQPYKFYSSFEVQTLKDFDHFFFDTQIELQNDKYEGQKKKIGPYRSYAWPMVDGYFTYVLKRDLDSFWELYEVSTGEEKPITELNISPDSSKPDLKRGYFVYTQSIPDRRYMFKSYSDIYLLSVYSKNNQRITFEDRYYHPKIHPIRNEIFAIHFDEKNQWSVESLDFTGKILNRLQLKDLLITEFVFKDEFDLIVMAQREDGYKALFQVNLKSQNLKQLTDYTRNNLFALNYSNDKVYFEADFQGKVENFALNINNKNVEICSQAEYAHFQPYIAKGKRHYIDLDAQGRDYKVEELKCKKVDAKSLTNFDKFLGNTIADNFTKSKPKVIKNYKRFNSKQSKSKEYSRLDDTLNLHSWNFFGGRGFQLEGISNNYLGDIALNGAIGVDAEEGTPFSYLNYTYAKYYPVIDLNLNYSKRNIKYNNAPNDEFTELGAEINIGLPYIFRNKLFSGSLLTSIGAGVIKVGERDNSSSYEVSDETLTLTQLQLAYSNTKDMRYRELYPSAGFTYNFIGKKADAESDSDFSNYLTYHKATFFKNSFWANHGFKLTLEEERQGESVNSYRINSPSSQVNQYVFARGYEYEYTPHFFKGSLNYAMPLLYMKAQFRDWIIFNRIYTNLFFDYTNTEVQDYERTFNSYGAELFFDSLTFRLLPITYGIRYLNKMKDNEAVGEVFIGLGIGM
jgi:hypothetical protein